jgi:CelD/BcsL family acetyltransferase involved in cellulose biosynthesis
MMVADRAVASDLSVRVTEEFAELPQLREEWQALFCARPNEPSTSFEWTTAMARHHARPGDRRFLVRVERNRALAAVVPLVLRRFKVIGQRIALLAPLAEDYNTHSDLLLQSLDDDTVDAVVSALFELNADWDCFRMARLLAENPLLTVMRRSLEARHHRYAIREGLSAYVLDLPRSYADYLSGRSAKFRNHLKRAERKLADSGQLDVHELADPGQFDTAFEALMHVERASWKHTFGSAITAVARQPRFYRDFGLDALGAGRLHLQWMTLDSRPIAYNLGYVTAGGYHYLKTSYDHEFRPMSPATVLRAKLIESLIARGIARLDFPGDPYEWESQWTKQVRRRVVLTVYRSTVRGRLLELVDRIRRRDAGAGVAHVDPRGSRPSKREPVEATT